jgi:hypothetical protein
MPFRASFRHSLSVSKRVAARRFGRRLFLPNRKNLDEKGPISLKYEHIWPEKIKKGGRGADWSPDPR